MHQVTRGLAPLSLAVGPVEVDKPGQDFRLVVLKVQAAVPGSDDSAVGVEDTAADVMSFGLHRDL